MVNQRRLRVLQSRAPQLALAALCAALSASSAAGGGAFATEITQIANNLQLVQQYAQMLRSYIRQGEELQQAILDYAESVRNSNPLPGQLFGPIEGELQGLANIVQQGRALNANQLVGQLDAVVKRHGFAYPLDPPSSERKPPVVIHSVSLSLDKAELSAFAAFADDLRASLPLVNIEQIVLTPDRRNPAQLDVRLKLSGLELLQ